MSDTQYTYAVARIRALELTLFSSQTIDQLLACETYDDAIKFLQDKGWGDSDTEPDAEAILNREREKTWDVVRDLVPDMSIFDVLTLPNEFHNLKAAIKSVGTDTKNPRVYYSDTAISSDEMERIIREKDYYALPKSMQQAASEATEAFFQTQDGQLCDTIVDKAALDAIREAGKASDAQILRDYAETTVAVADIKIAVRGERTGKRQDYLQRALAECDTLSTDLLIRAAISGEDALIAYLEGTDYAEGAKALSQSTSAFECWCDNQMIETIRPQKYNAFSIGPVVAYAIARENEIKTVRIILTGKANQLPTESIRGRVREMYV